MSVQPSKREHGQLEALTSARRLAKHTLTICANEKNFPKRYRWAVTSDIVAEARRAHAYARAANGVRVVTEGDYAHRRSLQQKAIAECNMLIGDMSLARGLFDIKDGKVDYWAVLADDTMSLLSRWRDSDYKRFHGVAADRSASPSYASNAYNVNPSGAMNYNNASNAHGVAPDCGYSQHGVSI